MKNRKNHKPLLIKESQKGFTVIEVMLFLAITGLMLVGALGGTYASISRQRYNDSVRSFAEFLRRVYSEVLSPASLNLGNSDNYAIYGKIIVFGLDANPGSPQEDQSTVYTATLVGDADASAAANVGSFMGELAEVNAKLYCGGESLPGATSTVSTLSSYKPEWGAEIDNDSNPKSIFKGTVIIARSPSSGAVRSAYTQQTFNINTGCHPEDNTASGAFAKEVQDNYSAFDMNSKLKFCVDLPGTVSAMRGVQLDLGGRNTSAVSILTEEEGC